MYSYGYLFIYVLIVLLNNKNINSSNVNPSGLSRKLDQVYQNAQQSLIQERANVENKIKQLNTERQHFVETQKKVQGYVNPFDRIRLNVGGQIIETTRRTLTKVPNSTLAKMFDGSHQRILNSDPDRNYFLDDNPVLFSHLLDQLRTLRKNETIIFRPPASSLLIKPFNKMLHRLGLPRPLKSENDIIALNVGGEKIVTLRKTLTGVPKSNLARLASPSKEVKRDRLGRPFLDYNPNLFRYLLDQLRVGKKVDDADFQSPSNESSNVFESMLIDLRVPTTTVAPLSKSKGTPGKSNKKKSAQGKSANLKTVALTTSTPKRKRAKRDILPGQIESNLVDNGLMDGSESQTN